MKHLKEIIQEKLKIGKTSFMLEKLKINSKSNTFGYTPKTKEELEQIIVKLIEQYGDKADLNDIDISNINDLSFLFSKVNNINGTKRKNNLYKFNGDISKWNVSKVENMEGMFSESNFNGDISEWNVSNVTNMTRMFAHSKFNKDISKWNVGKVINMNCMFIGANFNQDISNWNVSNVKDFNYMFEYDEDFDQDLNKWNVNVKHNHFVDMFRMTKLSEMNKLPKWYKK